jgi:FkbM family methyltransferase
MLQVDTSSIARRVSTVVPRFVDRYHRRHQIARRYLFEALGRFTPRVAVDSGNLRYYVSTQDLLGREVYSAGQFEIAILSDALDMLRSERQRSIEGATFLDIGANIGTTIIPAVKAFGASNGFAFEPEINNVKLLRQNVIENDLDERITVIPIALSDVNEDGVLELADSNWGDHRIRIGGPKAGGHIEETRPTSIVGMRRFDDVAADIGLNVGDVGLAWMDVQGHEGHVLSGAQSLLQSDVPVVTEYWPYGLRRAEGLDLFHALVSSHYAEVIDLRASAREHRTVSIPGHNVPHLEDLYSEDYTDLMLLK